MTAAMKLNIFNPLPIDAEVVLSPTQIMKAMVCLRQLGYYRARIKSEATPQNLLFGVALHWCVEGFIKGFISEEEMESRFEDKFHELSIGKLISMAKSKSRETATVVGKQLTKGFPAYFRNLGLKPLIIEGEFLIDLGGNTKVKMVIDFVGECSRPIYSPSGELIADVGDTVILDWKTSAMGAGDLFVRYGYQLTYYWLAVMLACKQLGIRPPKLCGYAEGHKPNITKPNSKSVVNAIWEPVHWVRRTQCDIDEAVDYARVVARRLRAGEFHRAPHMAYNSPCDTTSGRCDMAGLCLEGSLTGYAIKPGYALADLI